MQVNIPKSMDTKSYSVKKSRKVKQIKRKDIMHLAMLRNFGFLSQRVNEKEGASVQIEPKSGNECFLTNYM